MANVPLSKGVPHIYVPSLSIPKTYTAKINVPEIEVPGKAIQTVSAIPRKHIKDLGDIILGNPVTGTKQLRDTLIDNNLEELVYVPVLNRLTGLTLMSKERFIEPIIKGESSKALINTLETAGSTLDTLANPVKSLFTSAGGGTSDDFLKSLGWLDGAYREYYQFDTGNFFVDLAAEILTDPSNWITLGGKAAISEPAKLSTLDLDKFIAKTYGDEIVTTLGKTAKQELLDYSLDIINNPNSKHLENFLNNLEQYYHRLKMN